MRVLVITRAPWRNDNNTGNTMSNFFGNMKDFEFYNLYFRNKLPQNDIAIKSFAISESQLIKNLLKNSKVGTVVGEQDVSANSEERLYSNAKKHSNTLLMWLRDALWTIGRWKSDELIRFLEEVNPDIVFMPVFNCFYPHKVLKFIKQRTKAKIILFHADDNYTLKQFSLSPLYWLYRFNLRKWVRNSVKISDLNYAISNIQKDEYEKAFNKPFKVLTKGISFDADPGCKDEYNTPLQLVFTGNVITNRWKSLSHIANVLDRINKDKVIAQLRIYTGNVLSEEMEKALNKGDSSIVMGSVTSDKVKEVQRNADMLVHVEALDLKNKLTVRQSFSTKIVDYLASSRPILVFGPKDVASVDYFVRNGCAIVSDNEDELYNKLLNLMDNSQELNHLAEKAYNFGKENHSKSKIDFMLKEDFRKVVEN